MNKAPNAYSDVGPALCSFSSTQLIAAWKNIDQSLYFAIYNGTKWTAPSQIAGVGSSVGPSLAFYGGKLYYDGTKWSGQTPGTTQTQISGVGSSVGAAIAEVGGNLYAMCKGKDSDVTLYNSEFANNTWSPSPWANDIPGNTGPDTYATLAPPAGGNVNYLLADSKGAALTGTTVTIIVVDDIVSLQRTDGTYRYAFEINCYGEHDAAHPEKFVWQQFMFDVDTNTSGQNAQLSWWVNGYRQQDSANNPLLGSNRTRLTGLSSSRLPQGWQLTMTLTTEQSSSNVTGVTFSVTQPDGPPVSSGLQNLTNLSTGVTSANLAPILNVQGAKAESW
jgi:hypothetical protein